MSSEIRIILLMVAVLALAAWAVRGMAGEMPDREVRLNPPPQLQAALVRSAAGASFRSVSGF